MSLARVSRAHCACWKLDRLSTMMAAGSCSSKWMLAASFFTSANVSRYLITEYSSQEVSQLKTSHQQRLMHLPRYFAFQISRLCWGGTHSPHVDPLECRVVF